MKVETCVTISEDLLKELDEFANGGSNRSEFVETILREHINAQKRKRRREENAHEETEIIDRMAIEEREEFRENMRFQAELMLEYLDETR